MEEVKLIDYEHDRMWVADLEDRAHLFAYTLQEKDKDEKDDTRGFWLLGNKIESTTSNGLRGIIEYLGLVGEDQLKRAINEIHLNLPFNFPKQIDAGSVIVYPEILTPIEKQSFKYELRRLDSGILVYDD